MILLLEKLIVVFQLGSERLHCVVPAGLVPCPLEPRHLTLFVARACPVHSLASYFLTIDLMSSSLTEYKINLQ